MRLVVLRKITRISCALYFILFHFRLLNVGCIFSRIPFAILTLLSHPRRRVVRTSACPSDPHNSTSLVSVFPHHLLHTFLRCKASFFYRKSASLWFSVISGSCTRLFRSDSYAPTLLLLPALTSVFFHGHRPATPCTHTLHPQLWLQILVGLCLPTPARMPPTNLMPFHRQTAYALFPINQTFGMHVDHASWDRTLPLPRENGRALGFFTPRTLFHTSLQSSFPICFFCSFQNLVDHICRLGYHTTRQILL